MMLLVNSLFAGRAPVVPSTCTPYSPLGTGASADPLTPITLLSICQSVVRAYW